MGSGCAWSREPIVCGEWLAFRPAILNVRDAEFVEHLLVSALESQCSLQVCEQAWKKDPVLG